MSRTGKDSSDAVIPLPTAFGKNTFWYEQVMRDKNVAIYKQRLRPGVGELAYEVFIVKVAPATVVFGKEYPAREMPPRNEDWGDLGWTFPTLKKAKEKMTELLDTRDRAKGVSKR